MRNAAKKKRASAKAMTKKSANKPSRKFFVLPGRPADLPFSDAVLAGKPLYVAGHLGLDPKTGRIPGEVEQEIRLLLDGFKVTLAEAGTTMDDLVFVQVFCPDVSLFARFNTVYRTYFGSNFPARAFLGSGPLLFGAHFELQGIAVKL